MNTRISPSPKNETPPAHLPGGEGAGAGERAVLERPGVEERRLDVEHQEDDGHLVELDLEPGARAPDDLGSALVRIVLGRARPVGPQVLGGRGQEQREPDPAQDHERRGQIV